MAVTIATRTKVRFFGGEGEEEGEAEEAWRIEVRNVDNGTVLE